MTRQKDITNAEKQRLGFKLLSLILFKPIFIALAYSLSYLIFIYGYSRLSDKFEAFATIFVFAFLFVVSYYLIRFGSLIFDMIKDYSNANKFLGTFEVLAKRKVSNKYYLETSDPKFNRIKINRTIFNKIAPGQKVDLIISSSIRVYRYNPLIENFRIDPLV